MDEEEFPPWDWRRTQQVEKSFGAAEEQNIIARTRLADARAKIDSLQTMLSQADTSRQALMARIQMLESDRSALQGKVQALESRLTKLETPPAPPAPVVTPPSTPQGGS